MLSPNPPPPLSVGGRINPTTPTAQEHSSWPDGVCSARWTPESWERSPTNSILWRRHSFLLGPTNTTSPPTDSADVNLSLWVCLSCRRPSRWAGGEVHVNKLLTSGAGFKEEAALLVDWERDDCHKLCLLTEVTQLCKTEHTGSNKYPSFEFRKYEFLVCL